MNTADFLLLAADDQQIAVLEGCVQYTYYQLRAACAAIARALTEAGVQRQDRVAIIGPNSFFWIAAYLAILKVGAVAVPISTSIRPSQLMEMLKLVSCRALCLPQQQYTQVIEAIFSGCAAITDAIIEGDTQTARYWPPARDFASSQLAALMFTSGTTAQPRAVCVTHRNIQANTDSIIQCLNIDSTDRMMVILPFCYCFGTSLLHTHLRAGASLVLNNGYAYPEVVLDLMETTNCTSLAGVPSVYQTLLRSSTFPKRGLPMLRNLQQAGGKLPSVVINELAMIRPQTRIYVMYGQTEATARLSCLPPERLQDKIGSIGRGIPGVELRVVSETGQDVRPGEIGEIIARGDNVTAGYFGDADATARKFAGGALHTGDLATIDSDGFIYIVDRESDFIKPLGYRVSSQEVETCITALPEVVMAAAIGMPDSVQGEAIKVFVVLREGAILNPQMILTHCRRHLPRYMTPKEVVIVDSLPMSAQGKILKSALRSKS